ncbi:hypothetical protein MUK60_07560 [Streptomyces sp. LRE541]|uniref:type II toxin-antitoxin system RelE family toxin n=1 Tax=Streptomyces sp. LRE541 TaxID=2931983 RepID=UPI00200F5C3B|nr:hypothetical protein [Streptomyces sp. LRE541]UPZ27690.1 hypothetical protein MUK60_07560 [Streptomyces sp. LRE541]
MYELRYDPTIEAVWDSLPEPARDEFDRAILAACENPYGATEPYGIDDGITRTLVLDHTVAVLLVTQTPRQTVRILQITHLG